MNAPSPEFSTSSPVLPASAWWQTHLPDPSACVRLWCFPIIGTGAAVWHPWAAHLRGAAELVAICPPGREARLAEASLTRLDELVDALAAEIAPWVDERDVYCGHGPGAVIAFELAHRLRAAGAPGPRGLVVCNAAAPHRPGPKSCLHRLPRRDFVAAVESRFGPIPHEFHARPDFLDLLLPALRADLECAETHAAPPRPRLEIPILALGASHDPLVAAADLADWKTCTTSRFELARLEGRHFAVIEQPKSSARRVRDFLATL